MHSDSRRAAAPYAATLPHAGWLLILLFSLSRANAHDIPNDVTVQSFLKPTGNRLEMLVRVPLRAMRDTDFPTRENTNFLDLEKVDPMLPDNATLWISNFLELRENDAILPKPRILTTRLALLSDKSFSAYEQAQAHLNGPKLNANVSWEQVTLDILFEYPIQSERSRFSIRPGGLLRLGLRVVTVLRFLPPGGAIRAFEFESDPGLVELDPEWYQAAGRFVRSGFDHILDGTDHLLFLFCLVIPFRRFRGLVPVVTAFTLAHSITLIASAYNFAPDGSWFPPLIEMLIAASIVYMAIENMAGGATVKHRWMFAFGFGLIHGFGFSFALRETLQFAGTHMLTSLLSFNLGVELGQLLVLALLIPVLELLFRYVVAERMGTIILSALVCHTALHWMTERWGILTGVEIKAPAADGALWVGAMVWIVAITIAGASLWFMAAHRRDRSAQRG